ncbi:hypothetical protein HHI36_008861 [Cryptolaemus montrouzieri]|uniref:Uncharacterized protein n=1 Tax=Cryptolaemus montrouzieri TaxID=559131 RepID=A0ABD2MU81_9CUCU
MDLTWSESCCGSLGLLSCGSADLQLDPLASLPTSDWAVPPVGAVTTSRASEACFLVKGMYTFTSPWGVSPFGESWLGSACSPNTPLAVNATKTELKNLRDFYMKFKKGSEGETGQAKKYCKWPWSRHMSFIAGTFLYRQHIDNIPEYIQMRCPSSVGTSLSPVVNTNETPSSSQMLPPAPPKKKSKSQSALEDSDVGDKLIKKNENPHENQIDRIDHSFPSYAATFKTFRPNTQAMLKLKLATLFAETEILEIQEHEVSLTSFSSSTPSGLTTNYEIPEEYSRVSAPSASSDNAIYSTRDVYANFDYNN